MLGAERREVLFLNLLPPLTCVIKQVVCATYPNIISEIRRNGDRCSVARNLSYPRFGIQIV